jgi:hypothetical protein
MKKILFLLFIGFISTFFGQTVLWQNDFSDPTDWATSNDPSHTAGDWTITTNASAGPTAALNPAAFTSVANGYAIIDSDAEGPNGTQNAWIYYTSSINLSSQSNVVLQFQQTHRRYAETTYVIYSLDGGINWGEVEVNAGMTTNTNTTNPAQVQVNLSNEIGGQSSVLIGFKYIGNFDWFWAVDDVKLFTPPLNDLSLDKVLFGSTGSWGASLPYYKIPLSQISPIEVSGLISNNGTNDQNNVVFSSTASGSGFSSGSAGTFLSSFQTDTISTVSNFTPPSLVGTYTFNSSVSGNSESNLNDNSINGPSIEITEHIYARDNGVLSSGSFNQGLGFEVGNIFDIVATADLVAIDVVINSAAVAGAQMFVKLYSVDAATGDFVYVDESNPYTLTTANLGQKITLPFISGAATLNAGESYLVVAGSLGDGGATNDLVVGTAGISQPQTSFYLDETGTLFYTTSTPMVRMVICGGAPAINQTLNISECAPYVSPTNQTYLQSGTYNEVIPNVYGCDSVNLTINLTILNSSSNFSATICEGNAFTWNGQQYTQSGQYIQTLTNQFGCDSVVTLNLATYLLSSSFLATICDGDSYTWNGQQYYQAGQYYQTLVNQFGCDSVVMLNLNVNYNDNITVSPNPAFGNAPLNVAFANQTANLNNYTFTWFFGDGTTQQSNAGFLSHTYTQNGYANVTVQATNLTTGCTSSQTYDSLIFVIGGISCTHTATINQSGSLSGCAGDSILLSCNTDATFTYQWNRNGVPVSGATTNSFYPSQSGSYTVTIYQNNCPVTSSGISVTFNPLPSIPTITSTGTIIPCSGGTMTLSAPSGLSSYLWNTGATTSSINISQSGNYFVTVTNSSGCERTSNDFPVNASNITPPQVCIVGIDSLTNDNRIVWEKPLTIGIDSFYVYKETNVSNVYSKIGATDYNDLAVFLDINSNPAVQAYRYKISAFDTCGVESNVGDFHKTIHLTINQGIGGAWNLIWSHYEGLNFGSYNIYRGSDPSNISLLTTIQSNLNSYSDLSPPTGAIYYQIEVVNPVNCDPTKIINYGVSRSNIVNNGQVGLTEINSSTIQVYPNPTKDMLTLDVSNDLLGTSYFIMDFAGRIIQEGKINSLKQQIDLQTVSNGSYFLKVEGNKVIKVLKQ